MTAWLAILAIVGGLLVALRGLHALITLAWSPLPELEPRRPHARIIDLRNRRES